MYIYDIRININSNVKELEYDIIALVSLWHSCASSRLWGSGSTGIASDLVVFEFSSVHDHNRHRGQSACFLTELDTCSSGATSLLSPLSSVLCMGGAEAKKDTFQSLLPAGL